MCSRNCTLHCRCALFSWWCALCVVQALSPPITWRAPLREGDFQVGILTTHVAAAGATAGAATTGAATMLASGAAARTITVASLLGKRRLEEAKCTEVLPSSQDSGDRPDGTLSVEGD